MKKNVKKATGAKFNYENRIVGGERRAFRGKFKIRSVVLILLCFINFSNIRAQDVDDDAPIKVDTLLFTVPVSVSDKNGRNIPGLKEENFTIYQNGDEQQIEFFLNEQAPMNVAILLDTSYSTKKVLDDIQKAARDFIKILRPEDRAVIVSFDHQTMFLSGLTSDRKILSRAVDRAQVSETSGSDMYDAILRLEQNYFASLKGRKAIIALTDGMVFGNGVPAQKIFDTLQKSDTVFYPIIFKTNFYSEKSAGTKRSFLVKYLEIFAHESAGRFYEKDSTKLKEAFQSIAEELKKQYLLGFYPRDFGDNSPGHIRIEVDEKDFIVRAKKRLTF